MVISILIGALLWQLVCIIVAFATNEDEEAVFYTACGAWGILFRIVATVFHEIKLVSARKKYKLYQFWRPIENEKEKDSNLKYSRWLSNFYMTDEVAKHFRIAEESELGYIKLLREGKDIESVPYKSEIFTMEDLEHGGKGFSKEYLEKTFLL